MLRQQLRKIMPWLRPLRKWQRCLFFYGQMRFDGRDYAQRQSKEALPQPQFTAAYPLYNEETGFDMCYQENKVHNLRLAAQCLDGLLIEPGQTFSFWRTIRHADKQVPYKDGLSVVDGELTTVYAGGLCQMSNLLYWLFLHTPLTVVERHGHQLKDFPTSGLDMPEGVDATVAEGWLDLKMKNESAYTFQISLRFDEEQLYGTINADRELPCRYRIINRDQRYLREGSQIWEQVSVYRIAEPLGGGACIEDFLYENCCRVGYPLPEGTIVQEQRGRLLWES